MEANGPSGRTSQISRRIVGLVIAAAFVITGAVTAWAMWPDPRVVHIEGIGERLTFKTRAKDVAAALAEQGITVGEHDRISPPLTSSLQKADEFTVVIRRAVPVTVRVDGQEIQLLTTAETVRNVLHESGVMLKPLDRLSLAKEASVTAGMEVQVVRVTEERTVVEEEIPFETVRREDSSMNEGDTEVVQAGANGLRQRVKLVRYEDGKPVHEELVSDDIVTEPSAQVLAYGTASTVSRGGRTTRYSRELTMESTGYTAGKESNPDGNGYTYTGMKAEFGVVAVDPNVIPLYTRLYIEGYGYAIAGDIGGAIKGHKIDLCFDLLSEALEWGRRPVTVYILD